MDGDYHILFESQDLTATQHLKAVTSASLSFQSSPDSTPNEYIADWGRYLAGGTWTTTMEGEKVEHPYRWILNKQFLYNPRSGGPQPGLAVFGYDPATGKLTLWHFENSGLVGRSTIVHDDGVVWKLEGGGHSPEGEYQWTSTLVREDRDRLREKEIRISVGDKSLPETEDVWVKITGKQG